MSIGLEAVITLLTSPYAALSSGLLAVAVAVMVGLAVNFDKRQQRKHWEDTEEPLQTKSNPVFPNLPNFRQAGGKSLSAMDSGRKVRDGLLFRSSRTDFLTEKEKDSFDELGIRTIIDLRQTKEYTAAGGEKLLDEMYDPCVVKKGKIHSYKSKGKRASPSSGFRGRRYLVNMMTMDLIWHVFKQVNFFIRYISLILLVVDWMFSCHLFVRLFNWMVVNRQSLSQQYVDMLEYTKPAVADILRLVVDDDSTPLLIHCAHGKDRTGVIVAVILSCLGVDDETIAQDYAQSEVGLAPIRERLYRETVGRYGFRKEFARADAETMREVLREIKKRYGSMSSYLESANFSQEDQEKLRSIFLKPQTEQ